MQDYKVDMVNFAFQPKEITVPVGSTVTWVYKDTQCDLVVLCPGHDSQSETKGPDGQPLWKSKVYKGQGQTFTATMTVVGRHPYICTVHQSSGQIPVLPDMDGVVVVTAAAQTAAGGPMAPPQGILPKTGGNAGVAGPLGAALVLLGVALVGAGRRRASTL